MAGIMRIKPFRALRPTPEMASNVASVPYDTVDTAEATSLAAGNPVSFLHVVRPEINLPGADPYSQPVYDEARRQLTGLEEQGILVREPEPSLYVYCLRSGDHEQRGVVACLHVDDYLGGVILKHEKTRPEKENDRIRQIEAVSAHTGPIFLTYRDDTTVDELIARIMENDPLFDFTAPDGVEHRVWRVEGQGALLDALNALEISHIADGHHRAAAAAAVKTQREADNPGHTGEEDYNWFLGVLFPAGQLQVLPYNRCVLDLGDLSAEALLEAVRERFTVTENADPSPSGACHISMYLGGAWYDLAWEAGATDDPVAALDVSVLQDRLFEPVLGIVDPRTDKRLEFVGGIRGTAELERRVDSGDAAAAFSMYPVTVHQMMAVADADRIMPPKSTWFEPKLRSGLFVHTI